MKQHLDYIDLAKGLGIFLVIMGHSLFPIHQAIDIFHMPLFFFISGLTFKYNDSSRDFLIKKINRIFVPYIFFSIISSIIEQLVNFKGIVFNSPLWFLQTLFASLIITFFIYKRLFKYRYLFLIIFIICSFWICKQDDPILPFHTERAIRATIFIIIGYEFSRIKINNFTFKKTLLYLFTSLFFYIIFFFISYSKYNMYGNFLTGQIQRYHYILFYLTCFAGIFTTLFLSLIIKKIHLINWWGKHSLIILCVHFPLAEQLNVIIASTNYYKDGLIFAKVTMGILAYLFILLFSSGMILLCKKYIPSFTGYKPLVT